MAHQKRNFKKRFKKKIPIYRKRVFRYALGVPLATGALVYFIFFSPVFKIEKIEITGDDHIAQQAESQIQQELNKKTLFFIKKDNLFLFNANLVSKQIAQTFPELKNAVLEKHFPGSIFLALEKRAPVAILGFNASSSDNYFLIDEKGIVFQEYNQTSSSSLPLIISQDGQVNQLSQQAIDEATLKTILQINTSLNNLNLTARYFLLFENQLTAYLEEGWKIQFNLASDIDLTITKLKLLLEKEITPEKRKTLEYIDLRFSKAYYK